jgi:hypothetical protein
MMISASARDRIEEMLRKRICSACIESQPDGSCGLPAQYPCTLFRHLDRVINLVASTSSDSMEVYRQRLREVVCSNCRLDLSSGGCGRPEDRICPLDTCFPQVVRIVRKELATG